MYKKLIQLVKDYTSLPSSLKTSVNLKKIDLRNTALADSRDSDHNGLIMNGFKVFSQVDEDGIIEAIYNEIGTKSRIFVEIGCGNGLENNTHYLLLKGWKGVWVDGSRENIDHIRKNLTAENNLLDIQCKYVNPDNVLEVVKNSRFSEEEIDFLSVDTDGLEYELTKKMLELKPRVVCIEYNPELRPPLDMKVRTNAQGWNFDIYHGASLQSLTNMMDSCGYSLVGCNLSGYNSFFIKNEEINSFKKLSAEEAYQPPRAYLVGIKEGHKRSFAFLNDVLKKS